MKYIEKGSGPRELREWFKAAPLNEDDNKINCRYPQIPTDVKEKIIDSLLKEQGYICCYTGIRISEKTMHIEHLKPQSVSKRNGDHDDVAYENMLAAYPRGKCPFGARSREDWYEPENFIHPLVKTCEYKFKFDTEGRIKPRMNDDKKADKTISKLKLDHASLDEMRKQAIDEALFPEDTILSEAKLRRIVENGYSILDSKGRYPHFCFIIEQVAEIVLKKAERERKRRQAIQKKKSKRK